jgi:hypothetical protein
MAGEHQQARRYQFLAAPGSVCEAATGDDPGAFGSDVVAPLRYLAEVIDQGLQFGPSGGGGASPSVERIWAAVDMPHYRTVARKCPHTL